eukprot:3974325-Pyramimonas_sp.AAC.1
MLLPSYVRTTSQKSFPAPRKVSKQRRTSIASQGPTRENPPVSVPSWCSTVLLATRAKLGWNGQS